jgi:hypothetical protein
MAKTNTFDKQGKLHSKTHALLQADERGLAQISIDTGISFYWLQRFNQNAFKNPSVNRVEYLYEQLTGKALSV